jgi:hypothetical protein
MQLPALFAVTLIVSLLAACGSPASRPFAFGGSITQPLPVSEKGNEVALYALGLIDTGYRFGGRNPGRPIAAGWSASSTARPPASRSWAALPTSPAAAGRSSRVTGARRPGFLQHPISRFHVGIYLGDSRFVPHRRPVGAYASTA